ncbi:MAG: hypothetical protein R3C05_09335 [Pirellulaceae bacterium]
MSRNNLMGFDVSVFRSALRRRKAGWYRELFRVPCERAWVVARCAGSGTGLVEQVQDRAVEILLIRLLFVFKVFSLWMAFGNTCVGNTSGIELTGGLVDATHRGLVASQNAKVILPR